MATAREVLQLIITGDGRGAIAEMEKVGAASRRNLGETERSIGQMSGQLMSFGAVSIGAGTLAAAGLFRTAQAAGTLDMNVQRMRGNFGSAAEQAIAFGKNYEYLSDIDATTALAQVGELATGLGVGQEAAAGFATRAVDVVTQLALLKGVGAQDALHTINAALIGEYDSLQKLVPNISAAKIEQKALADTGKENAKSLTDAEKAMAALNIIIESGSATIARSGDVSETAAGRTARLAAQWGDLKVRIGEEALPAMESVIDVGSDAIGVFERVDDATGGWASRLAIVGTVGSLAAGGLSLVVGSGMKLVDTFGDLRGRMRDAEGGLTRTGVAARGLGGILAGITMAEVGWSITNQITDAAGRMEQARKDLEIALGEGQDPQSIIRAFSEQAGAQDGGLIRNLVEDFGKSFTLLPDVARETVEDIERTFEGLSVPDQSKLLGALRAYRSTLADGSVEARDYDNIISNLSGRYERNATAASLAADATNGYGDATDQASDANRRNGAALDALSYAYERTADAAEGVKPGALAYAEAVRGSIDPVLGLMDANDRLKDAEERMADAARTNGKDVRDASRAVADARRRVSDATENLSDAQRELNEVLNDDPLMGFRQVSPEQEIADARKRLAEANRDLAKNPLDPNALTKRDLALSDLEDASERAQRIKREGEQRVEQIRNARKAVEDAQRGLTDAQQGVTDAQERLNEVQSEHGLNSKAYRDASRDVIRANLDVQDATAVLAQYLRDHGIEAIGDINEQLDKWIALGGPTGAAAQQIKDQMQPLVIQALLYAAALKQANDERDRMGKLGPITNLRRLTDPFGWGSWTGGGGDNWKPAGTSGGKTVNKSGLRGNVGGGGLDGDPLTFYATGGFVPDYGIAEPGEFVMRPEAVRRHGLPMMYALNSGRPLTHRLAGAAAAAGGSSTPVEGSVTFAPRIYMQPRDDRLAGEAVIQSMRGVAWRAGKGVRAGRVLEGRR